MRARHWPLVGVVLAACVLAVATSRYPGGTVDSIESVGYDWARNTISALFQPKALNGSPNSARTMAVVAALLYCLSMAVVFGRIAARATTTIRRKAIQIGGIGSMVYAFLAVTPMHDLMVAIALPFFMVAVAAVLHGHFSEGRTRLFTIGLICVALPTFNAAMYYGDFFYSMLPVVQKLGTVAVATWLLASYYQALGHEDSPVG